MLNLKLQFGGGQLRIRLLEMAREHPGLFAAPPVPSPQGLTTIWRMPLLTREDYLENTYSVLEHLLRERWGGFLKGPFRQLSETVRRQEWMRTDTG